MTSAAELRELNRRVGAPGRLAVVLLVVALIACGLSMRSFAGALFAPSAKAIKGKHEEITEQLKGDYAKTLAHHSAQFTGRSVFFIPSAPPPPAPPPPPPVATDTRPPPPPPPPSTYSGPKLIAMVNSEAWFDDGQKLIAGSEGKDGLQLKEVRPPWEVAVIWKEVEFIVSLFDRDRVVYPPPKVEPTPQPLPPLPESTPEGLKESAPVEPAPVAPATPGDTKPDEPKPGAPSSEAPNPEVPKPDVPTTDPESPKPDSPKPATPPSTPEGNQ